jgi:uncharacterized protein YwgA
MPFKSALDAIITLLFCPGNSGEYGERIEGITRLDKLLYLLVKETKVGEPLEEELGFEAYDYGPYSSEIYDAMETLSDVGLVNVQTREYKSYEEISDARMIFRETLDDETALTAATRQVQIFALSEGGMRAGKKLFDLLSPEEQTDVRRVKERFNSISLKELIEYVYRKYPYSAVKSKVKESILKGSKFGSRTEMKPFVREEEEFRP